VTQNGIEIPKSGHSTPSRVLLYMSCAREKLIVRTLAAQLPGVGIRLVSDSDRRRIVLTANAAVFVNFLSYLGLTPLYPQVAHDLNVGAAGFGSYFLVQGLVSVALQLPVGVLADRYGRRPIMLIGLLFMLAGQLLRWQAYQGWIFLVSQIAIGLCGPFIVSASYALIADVYTHGRARALGLLQGSINVGQGTGFLLAGLLAPWLGWRGYSLCVAVLPLLLIPLTLRQPPIRSQGPTRSIGRSMLVAFRFLAVPAAAMLAIVAALNLGVGSGATYILPFLTAQHQATATVTSIVLIPFLVASIAGGPLAGTWADKAGIRLPALACIGCAMVGLLGMAFLDYSLFASAACMALIGGAVSGMLTLAAELVVNLAGTYRTGSGAALGGMRIGQGLGPTLAPALVGFVFDSAGPTSAYLAMAVGMVAAGALVLAATRNAGRGDEIPVG
jgi:predicted MFS family arabinose efflux permease